MASNTATETTIEQGTDQPRGRKATGPRAIPWAGWKDVAWRVWKESSDDNLGLIAAGVAFYWLLALFPALAALVSLWGLFSEPRQLLEAVEVIETILPPSTAEIVSNRLAQLQAVDRDQLSAAAIGGLLFSLWSARRGMVALMLAHNIVYEENDKRFLVRRTAVSIVLTVAAIIFLIFTLPAIITVGVIPHMLSLYGIVERALQLMVWLILAIVYSLALATLYRLAPYRRSARWRWVTPGAVFATVLWLALSIGFSIYVENFGAYDQTYGTLGGVVVLMLWFFLSALIVLLGAEINAEMEHQTARDSTIGDERPLGERGAYVADTLGPTLKDDPKAGDITASEYQSHVEEKPSKDRPQET